MSKTKIRVALADDQRLLRESLQIILEATDDIELVGCAEDGLKAVQLAQETHPDVFLMDIRMPYLDGIAATRQIQQKNPACRVLLLTTYDEPEHVMEGLRAGATGYMFKDCSTAELRAAIHAVAQGQFLLHSTILPQTLAAFSMPASPPTPSAQNMQEDRQDIQPLTSRELDVLHSIAQGYNNSEIAAALSVSEATIKTHINHIFSKLSVRDRVQAIAKAQKLRLL